MRVCLLDQICLLRFFSLVYYSRFFLCSFAIEMVFMEKLYRRFNVIIKIGNLYFFCQFLRKKTREKQKSIIIDDLTEKCWCSSFFQYSQSHVILLTLMQLYYNLSVFLCTLCFCSGRFWVCSIENDRNLKSIKAI